MDDNYSQNRNNKLNTAKRIVKGENKKKGASIPGEVREMVLRRRES
ncbi:hypothetical protein CCACVL1_11465 [Corchorus capsularis]|uniref:Uncharacterized protein n=1 Tax=Corchorus capsularis TaxID=210143 RepID=A0A1R3IL34_COCAP|nr:hypothetical protein CCACVL1_11465 [Corchorus capsularis]